MGTLQSMFTAQKNMSLSKPNSTQRPFGAVPYRNLVKRVNQMGAEILILLACTVSAFAIKNAFYETFGL